MESTAEYVEIGTGDPVCGETFVEFRLLYSGVLLGASRSDTRASLKHQIRRQFHPQLKHLWETHKGLRDLAIQHHYRWVDRPSSGREEPDEEVSVFDRDQMLEKMRRDGLRYLAEKWERFGCGFIPLVSEEFEVRCAIDILFLRPEDPGRLLQSGDLDNRVKTVFDSLRIPKDKGETGGEIPVGDENPMYCLLEDDKLISEVRVVTDRLLMLPKTTTVSANEVFLVLHVTLERQVGTSRWF